MAEAAGRALSSVADEDTDADELVWLPVDAALPFFDDDGCLDEDDDECELCFLADLTVFPAALFDGDGENERAMRVGET